MSGATWIRPTATYVLRFRDIARWWGEWRGNYLFISRLSKDFLWAGSVLLATAIRCNDASGRYLRRADILGRI